MDDPSFMTHEHSNPIRSSPLTSSTDLYSFGPNAVMVHTGMFCRVATRSSQHSGLVHGGLDSLLYDRFRQVSLLAYISYGMTISAYMSYGLYTFHC